MRWESARKGEKSMELVAIGGDLRYAHLVDWARRDGVDAAGLGLEYAGVDIPQATLSDLRAAEAVVIHNPFGAAGMVFPYAQNPYRPEEVWAALTPGTQVYLFGPGEVPKDFCQKYPTINLSGNEHLTKRNAVYTAEGAIHAVSERALFSLSEANVMVIGYGRIGRALTGILLGYGSRVTVAARSPEARSLAERVGARAVDMEEMLLHLPAQRIVFSTPPQRVLEARQLACFRKDALLVDLSSPPYGIDLKAAQTMGLSAWREPGLPGRYCPEGAGRALLDAIREARKGGVTYE
jgi:dipicolinate synthase subunit A